MLGDRVEVLIDVGGAVQTFDIVATKAGRRVEVSTGRGRVEVGPRVPHEPGEFLRDLP